MVSRTYTFGVRFRKGFDMVMLVRQAGMDRYVHNLLLGTLREDYHRMGKVDTTRGRVNAWYTSLRNATGPRWLRRSISGVTRQTLVDLGRHYGQYVETERCKAAGIVPETIWGEPHFKRRGDRISIPLTITHDNTAGSARFTSGRTIRIQKMGEITLSRPFPVLNYRPKTARLFRLADGKWRMAIACEVPDERPPVTEPVVIGVDRNVGNIATPTCVIEPPGMMVRRMANTGRAAARAQRMMARRQRPDGRSRKPGSRRWVRAAKRAARQKRRAANIRRTIVHKTSRVAADNCTHTVLENLPVQDMTKSAKGTVRQPGTNVRQKSGLNRSILEQCWGLLAVLLSYKLAGGLIWVASQHTSQKCYPYGFIDKDNRRGRWFVCGRCGHQNHADCNAGANIQAAGLIKIGRKARAGRIVLRYERTTSSTSPGMTPGSAHVKGRLDAEGSGVGLPVNRQTPTGDEGAAMPRTIVLWNDV